MTTTTNVTFDSANSRLETAARPVKTVVIVAPHFPPSNLASVHRARLLSRHLAEFGWHPVIVTTHWQYYEEKLDWELATLVAPGLEVIHTKALATKPLRLVGDIGIRGMWWHYRVLRQLQREGRIDFLLLTIPSFFSALLGQLLFRQQPLLFGIDYIDPWVHVWPEARIKYSKAWFAMKLGEWLEPWAVRNASLISAVAPGYFQGVLERNPHLHQQAVTAAMPYGFSPDDYLAPSVAAKQPLMFDPNDGQLHFVYAGALLPKAVEVLESFFAGLAELRRTQPTLYGRLHFHFIGTGKAPIDEQGHNIVPIAQRCGVADLVSEHPHRMAYLDVLVHLTKAHCILIVGSTESHYTPSKVFQAVQSRRPLLALLHEESTAVEVIRKSGAGLALTLTQRRLPTPAEVCQALQQAATSHYDANTVDWQSFDAYSARTSARILAEAMDRASIS